MTLCNYREHAFGLATQHRVWLVEHADMKPEQAVCLPGIRELHCHPIIEETTYCVVLHEMGHLVHPKGCTLLRPPTNVREMMEKMEEEDAAWEWAKSVAIEWTPAMDFVHQWARETYRKDLEMRVKASIRPIARKLSEWR